MLVWKDHRWLAELVSWSGHVVNLEVALTLLLINLEEEVLLGDDLLVGGLSECLLADLVFELNKPDLLLDDFVNFSLDLLDVLRA